MPQNLPEDHQDPEVTLDDIIRDQIVVMRRLRHLEEYVHFQTLLVVLVLAVALIALLKPVGG
jgi:hypothetical protein